MKWETLWEEKYPHNCVAMFTWREERDHLHMLRSILVNFTVFSAEATTLKLSCELRYALNYTHLHYIMCVESRGTL